METHWAKLGIQGMEALEPFEICPLIWNILKQLWHLCWKSFEKGDYPNQIDFRKSQNTHEENLVKTCEGSAPLNTWQKTWIILIKMKVNATI